MTTTVRTSTRGTRSPHWVAWPALTLGVLVTTTVVSIAAFVSPALMTGSTRDLHQLQAGQWWRAVTPVLVQPDGWGQLAFNMLGLVIVGMALQRYVTWSAWLSVYVVGGVGAIAVASAWYPTDTGGGSSAAVAALIGALTVLRFADGGHSDRLEWLAEMYSVFFVVYLTAFAVGGPVPAGVAGNASIVLVVVAHRAWRPTTVTRGGAATVLALTVVLCAVHDDHGVGLAAGALIAALILGHRRLRDGGSHPQLRVLVACVGVAAASLLTWFAWVHLLGVELLVSAPGGATSAVGWPSVITVSFGACLAAYLLQRILVHRARVHAEATWRGVCVGVAGFSLLGPLHLAVGASSLAGLLSLHVVCAVTTLALLAHIARAEPVLASVADPTSLQVSPVRPGRRP